MTRGFAFLVAVGLLAAAGCAVQGGGDGGGFGGGLLGPMIAAQVPQARPSEPASAPSAAPAAPAESAAPDFASDVDQPPLTGSRSANDFALIVGVDRYQALPEAKYAERDAEAFKRYAIKSLGVPEENAILLTGARATRTGLAKYIEEWLPRNVNASSRVWFYYSGHGAPDPADGSAYLVPWDGDPSFLKSSGYALSTLYAKLGATKAAEVVVILDSCFSGAGDRSLIASGSRPLVNVNVATPASGKISVLSASASTETAGALDAQRHGLFTYYFLKGLGGEAVDAQGRVTLGAMRGYLSANVEREAHRQNREQTPQASGSANLQLY